MPSPVARRFRAIGAFWLAGALVLAVAGTRAEAAQPFVKDTFFRAGYERQVDGRTCTAAVIAMIANFMAGRDLNLPQHTILRYAQRRDALNDRVQRGSDPLGMSEGATAITRWLRMPTTYTWAAFDHEGRALRAAALSIARYGKPVGLLTKHGRHAVIMTGFEATSNPARGGAWVLLAVYVSDPLGPVRTRYAPATKSPLDRYRELDATPAYDRLWYNRWIVVLPRN